MCPTRDRYFIDILIFIHHMVDDIKTDRQCNVGKKRAMKLLSSHHIGCPTGNIRP